jgi:hypothetical protein
VRRRSRIGLVYIRLSCVKSVCMYHDFAASISIIVVVVVVLHFVLEAGPGHPCSASASEGIWSFFFYLLLIVS